MEYFVKWTSLFLILQLSVVTLSQKSTHTDLKHGCRKCKPGYYAVRKCNDVHDTICRRCPVGTFTSKHNKAEKCSSCSSCEPGTYSKLPCTFTEDTKCDSCSSAPDKTSSSYRAVCLGDFSELMFSDQGKMSKTADDTLSEEGSGEESTEEHKINIGSGIILLPTSSTNNDDVKPEISETNTHIYKNVSVSSEESDEVTGSGDVTLDIGIAEDTFNLTGEPEVNFKNAINNEFETTTGGETSSTTSDLVNLAASEILLPIGNEKSTILLGSSGSGEMVTDAEPEPVPEIKTTVATTTESKELLQETPIVRSGIIDVGKGIHIKPDHGKRKGHTRKQEYQLLPPAEPFNGEKNMGDDSQKVTIGVVVAVAVVAAIVFFVLGFIVSRYCRRRRHSFQVMKKVDKSEARNGGVPVSIGVEYRDPETHTGIYDEIDRNGKSPPKHNSPLQEDIVPTAVEDVYAVPDKVKKGQESPVIEEQLDRIKFIDETTDEEFGGRDEEKLGLLGTIDLDLENKKNGKLPTLNGSIPHIVESENPPTVDSFKPETDIPSTPEPDMDKIEDMTKSEDDGDTADDHSTSEASYHVDEKEEENIDYEEGNVDESSPMLMDTDNNDTEVNE